MILFFDTETTGLPKNWKAQFNSIQFNQERVKTVNGINIHH